MKKKRPSFLVVLAAILFFLFQVTPLFGFEEELLTPTMSALLEEPAEEPEITEVETSPFLEETPASLPALSPAVFSSPAAFFEEEALPASNAAEVATVSSEPSPKATAENASQVTVSPAAVSADEEAPPEKSGLFSLWNDLKRFLRIRTLSLTEKDFQADEKVKINLRDYKAAELKILVFDHRGREVEIMAEEDNGDINIFPQKTLRPGRYTLKAFEGEELVLEENFTWGVLAINTHKSIYQPQETAKLAMAVLDEEGNMVCDAKVELRIKNEKQAETVLSTDEGTIKVNPECQLHDFTLNPDYEAEYEVGEAGVYEMELTAETKNGRYTVTDSFEVRNEVPFEVERITATRIYPPASYPVVFKIKVNQDFKGEVVESIPDIFIIQNETEDDRSDFHSEFISESITESHNGEKQIIWEVDWHQGETHELAYQFKVPDISPQFYLLGPLAFRQTVKKINLPEEALEDEAATFSQQIDPATQTIADPLLESSPSALAKESVNVVITEEIVVFQEARRWQLAIDAALTLRPNADGTTTGWTTSGGGSTNLYAEIDDDPDSPTDTDYVQGPNKTNSSMFVELGNTPSDFESAGTVEIKARHQENGNSNDTITIYYQIFQSDGSTALTAETAGTTLTQGSWTTNAYSSLSITGTNSKTVWDGAKLRIRQVYAKVGGSDTTSQARISAAEVNLTYTPLSPPSAPTNVSATDGTYTDKVVVSWTKSTGATGYKVYEGSNLLATLGDVATYDDTTAPAPTITAGSASASDGTSTDYVALSLSGQSANNGSSRTYKVIAYNDAGDSGDSNTDAGYRGVGSLTYQWQRSAADSDADYSNIDGATTASYNDTGAPANGDGRYYRCVLNATGASQQTSTSDRGYRQAPPAQLNQKSYRWRNDDGGEGSSEVWYSQDWDYRKPVAITNSNEATLENFQVQVSLDTSTLITNNKMKSDCADIRFTDSDKKTLINYWIESGCDTTDTKIWVKIPSISTAGKNIYLYYGNSSASSAADGEAVFDFFDDFLGTSLDTDKWQDFNPESFGSLEVADGLLKLSGVSNGSTWKARGVFTANTFTFPSGGAVIEANNKWNLANQYSAKEVRIANGVPSDDDSGYQWRFDYSRTGFLDEKKYRFVKNDGGAGTQVTSIGISNNSPANFEIERYVWYDVGGQAQVATRSTDGGDSFTSLWNAAESSWSLPASRYLGYTYSNRQTTSGGYAHLDWIRVRKYASSQPGASPGTEESQPTGGGASWKAVENTAVSDIEKNKNIRLRFSINNSGGQNATASFRLQVAPKGEAANCEAVLSANFTDVPTATGSAVAVMTTSANFTDQDATTAQLTASATTFVAGKMVSYPSNQAGSLTLGGDRYTEVEYNFQMTNNAAASTTYCFRVNNAGTALDSYNKVATLTTKAANQAPNAPASLAQKKTDDTSLAVGAWTNETSVKFSATVSDPDSADTLYLCVEKDILGTSFSGGEDLCGSGVAYSGTAVEATVTISGITDANQYHWQARVKDEAGAYSSWVSFGENLETDRDFGVDTSAPSGGAVYDGEEEGVDKSFNNGSLSQLSANWANFDAGVSGLDYYQYAIGTSAGGTDVKAWTSAGASTAVTATDLTLTTSTPYYFSVRAVDKAGNIQSPAISSNGQLVAPSLIFSVSPDEVSFANLNAGNDYTDSKTVTLTTSTNAYNGYLVRAFITDYLRSADNAFTIADFDGGTYEAPGEWLTGNRGFGYHSSDTLVGGVNKFNSTPCPGGGSLPCFAPFSHSGPGEVIADHTANVSGIPISNEEFEITLKVKTDAGQPASTYLTNIIYTITAKY